MKLFAATLAVLASAVLASPVAPRQDLVPYTLKISSSPFPALVGQYLSSVNSSVGVYPDASPVEIFVSQVGGEAGTVSLHTLPIGIIDHALGFIGGGEVSELKDIPLPATNPDADYTLFGLDAGTGELTYTGKEGEWVAFPRESDSWQATWKTPSAFTTTDFMPITIALEAV